MLTFGANCEFERKDGSQRQLIRPSLSKSELERCESVAGRYYYNGRLLGGELHGNAPTIANMVLRKSVSQETIPKYFQLDLMPVMGNEYDAKFRVFGKNRFIENAVLLSLEQKAFCKNGVLIMLDEYRGSTDGTPLASWEVIEIKPVVTGIQIKVTISVKIWPLIFSEDRQQVSAVFRSYQHNEK